MGAHDGQGPRAHGIVTGIAIVRLRQLGRRGAPQSKRILMRKAVVVLVAALVGTVVAWTGGAAAQDLGPAVGARAPEIGAPLDQTGKPRALESLMGDKGLILFFFRSTVW